MDDPGARGAVRQRRRPRDLAVAPASQAQGRPDAGRRAGGGAGMSAVAATERPPVEEARASETPRRAGWAGIVLGFLAFFLAVPPATVRTPAVPIVLGV